MPTFVKNGLIETSFSVCSISLPLASICLFGFGLSCHVFSTKIFEYDNLILRIIDDASARFVTKILADIGYLLITTVQRLISWIEKGHTCSINECLIDAALEFFSQFTNQQLRGLGHSLARCGFIEQLSVL